MSQLVDLFNNSNKPRVTQARQIPGLAVNFIDQTNTFQDEFKNELKPGDPTTYTSRALKYYNEELKNMVIPESFVRSEPDIPLNRYNPDQGYYAPGSPQG